MDPASPSSSSRSLGYASPGELDNPGASSQTILVFECLSLIGAIAATGLLIWATRFPMSQFELAALGVVIWIAVGIIWIFVLVFRLTPRRPRIHIRITLPPLLLLVMIVLLHYQVPCRLMFAANRSALTAWAKSTLSSPPPKSGAIRSTVQVGAYRIFNIERLPGGGVQFFVEGSGFFRATSGYAYSPTSPPANTYCDTYAPVGNGWYSRLYVAD